MEFVLFDKKLCFLQDCLIAILLCVARNYVTVTKLFEAVCIFSTRK